MTVEFLPGGPVGSGGIGVPPMGWVAALDVTSPPLSETIQIAGKEVRRGANQLLFSLQDRAGVAVRR